MRDRLIELICNIKCKGEDFRNGGCALRKDERCIKIDNLDMCMIGCIADHLLANGVIVPPCKVGDTVYSCIGRPYKVEKITIKRDQDHMTIVLDSALSGRLIVYENDFGQIVFLTREEAEKALAERRGE